MQAVQFSPACRPPLGFPNTPGASSLQISGPLSPPSFSFLFFKPLLLIALGHPAVTLFIWFVAVPGISRARPVKAEPLPDALLLSL